MQRHSRTEDFVCEKIPCVVVPAVVAALAVSQFWWVCRFFTVLSPISDNSGRRLMSDIRKLETRERTVNSTTLYPNIYSYKETTCVFFGSYWSEFCS